MSLRQWLSFSYLFSLQFPASLGYRKDNKGSHCFALLYPSPVPLLCSLWEWSIAKEDMKSNKYHCWDDQSRALESNISNLYNAKLRQFFYVWMDIFFFMAAKSHWSTLDWFQSISYSTLWTVRKLVRFYVSEKYTV